MAWQHKQVGGTEIVDWLGDTTQKVHAVRNTQPFCLYCQALTLGSVSG